MVGTNTKNQIIIRTATAVVDHGMEAATRTGYISTEKNHNRDRIADVKGEGILAGCWVDLAASTMFIGPKLSWLECNSGLGHWTDSTIGSVSGHRALPGN
jgi:hypothetical protein